MPERASQVLTARIEEGLAASQEKKPFPFPSLLDVRELALENLSAAAGSIAARSDPPRHKTCSSDCGASF